MVPRDQEDIDKDEFIKYHHLPHFIENEYSRSCIEQHEMFLGIVWK